MANLPQLITSNNIKAFINSFDTVLSDCDGVLWAGEEVIGEANTALNLLQSLGKKVFYVTNNSSKSRAEYVGKCEKLGFKATKESIISSSYVLAQYLKDQKFTKKVYIVGTSGMSQELDDVGIQNILGKGKVFENMMDLVHEVKPDPEVGAVAVGFDPQFCFSKIAWAASYLDKPDCLFLATNTDERFPVSKHNMVFPGTGCLVRCVETVAERSALVMGKPSEKMFSIISEKYNLQPSRTLMIGDRCNTDILFGKNCGLHTLLVLSGVTSMHDVESFAASSDPKHHSYLADYYLPQIGDLVSLLSSV